MIELTGARILIVDYQAPNRLVVQMPLLDQATASILGHGALPQRSKAPGRRG